MNRNRRLARRHAMWMALYKEKQKLKEKTKEVVDNQERK